MNKNNLKLLRDQIDILDEVILVSLSKRQKLVKDIGEIKKKENIQILDTKRWEKLLKSRLGKARELDLSEELARKIYEQIHKNSIEIQELQIKSRGGD